jgi:hypothetical protein
MACMLTSSNFEYCRLPLSSFLKGISLKSLPLHVLVPDLAIRRVRHLSSYSNSRAKLCAEKF